MKFKLFSILLIVLGCGFLNVNISLGSDITTLQKVIREKGAKWTAGETSVSNLSSDSNGMLEGTIKRFLKANTALGSDIKILRKAIKKNGANWTAGETSVSNLTIEEMKNRCGIIFPENYTTREREESVALSLEAATTFFDWRDWNTVTPIKDQGRCSSCYAFATVGAFESKLLISGVSVGNDLSEQLMVSCDTSNLGCVGGWMGRACDFLQYIGTTPESCFLYKAMDLNCNSSNKCSDWRQKLIKIGGWAWVSNNENSIKNALVKYGPLPTTLHVHEEFYSYTGGVYERISGVYDGGHAVIIVGWDDFPEIPGGGTGKPCWICKNSWGTGWGEDGYFRIAIGDSCNIGALTTCFYLNSTLPSDEIINNYHITNKKSGCFLNNLK